MSMERSRSKETNAAGASFMCLKSVLYSEVLFWILSIGSDGKR